MVRDGVGAGMAGARGPQVHCVRLERSRPVAEHVACRYCFGGAREVATAQHARFCDFEPGRDPVAFGFPAWAWRHR